MLTKHAWIGANDLVIEGTHVWAGGPEAGQPVFFTNWGSDEPNDVGGNEDCLVIYPIGEWNDENCGNVQQSVIEYSCPPGQEFGPSACQGTRFLRQSGLII